MKRMTTLSLISLFAASAVFGQDAATATEVTIATTNIWSSVNWGLVFAVLGAAFATFAGGYGSSIGVGLAGEVGNAVLTEDGKKFGSVLVLQALPMTQGIYGLLYAFMVLGVSDIDLTRGIQLFFASLPVGISGYISGVWQGKVSAAGMQLIARRPKQMGQAIILPAMVETFAVFGLLASILLMNLGQ
ncbi:MAG: V-type ATP synthase subunit K [Brevinema sp.]